MNIFLNTKTTKIGLIALSIFSTFTVSVPLNFNENPLFAQNNISTNEGKKAQAEKLFNEAEQLYKQGTKESLEQAIIKWKQALLLYQQIGDKSEEALTYVWLGFVYNKLGFPLETLNYYNLALPLYQQLKDRLNEAVTLNNIGGMYSELGEKQKALEYLQMALPLRKVLGDKKGEGVTLHNMGIIYSQLGEKQKALEYYQQS